ncbi:MAG: PTS sugar transporter subunit IIA [Lachnospiraceae bacterium]|nr:PTS sugar transporter subunit IIA [Lachnospiraceae bacterium]
MNKQTTKLLTILLDSPGSFFHYEKLAVLLGVSTRSVRNYIQLLQDFLKVQKLSECLECAEGAVAFVGSQENKTKLLDSVVDNEFYLYRLSPSERVQIIFLLLLTRSDYCTLNELTEKFNASRTTLLKDMEQVKQMLSLYDLSFAPAMNKGYLLQAEEIQRREIIIRIIQSSMGTVFSLRQDVNLTERFLYDEWHLEEYFPCIRTLLLETEHNYEINVTDAAFEETTFVLALVLHRLLEGYQISEKENEDTSFRNLFVYELAEYMLKELAKVYPITYEESEIVFLASRLYYSRFYNRHLAESTKDVKLHMALKNFVLKIGEALDIPVINDAQMLAQLENHLRDIEKLYAEGSALEYDYTVQIIEEYPDYYQLVHKYIYILEEAVGHSYSESDIAVVLIYIVVAVNRYSKNHMPLRVILVCHTGNGTANFLAEQLNSYFNIRILAITSNHKLQSVKERMKYDLIISTISLQEPEGTWVKVSPMLTDEEILRLQKLFIETHRKKKQWNFRANLGNALEKSGTMLLKEENIFLDIMCRDWKNAISSAAAPLLLSGNIDSRYVEAMIRSKEINGAYFVYCPSVALVHADPNVGVHVSGMSLVRLKSPVAFGHAEHDPVKWCICMACKESEMYAKEIIGVMNLFSESELRGELEQMTERKEVFSYINKYLQEVSNE